LHVRQAGINYLTANPEHFIESNTQIYRNEYTEKRNFIEIYHKGQKSKQSLTKLSSQSRKKVSARSVYRRYNLALDTCTHCGPIFILRQPRSMVLNIFGRYILPFFLHYLLFADKPTITVPFQEVRTVPEHYVWCSAEGTPPINSSLLNASNCSPLASGIGKVGSKIKQNGNYTCMAKNEAGFDTRDFTVAVIGKH